MLDAREDVGWDDSLATLFLGLDCGQIENFSCQKFEDGGEVDWGLQGDATEVGPTLEHASDSSNRELKV